MFLQSFIEAQGKRKRLYSSLAPLDLLWWQLSAKNPSVLQWFSFSFSSLLFSLFWFVTCKHEMIEMNFIAGVSCLKPKTRPAILRIPLDKIKWPLIRTRANDPKKVKELMESIRLISLQELVITPFLLSFIYQTLLGFG